MKDRDEAQAVSIVRVSVRILSITPHRKQLSEVELFPPGLSIRNGWFLRWTLWIMSQVGIRAKFRVPVRKDTEF